MPDPAALRALSQIRRGSPLLELARSRARMGAGYPADDNEAIEAARGIDDDESAEPMPYDVSNFSDGRPQSAYNPSSLRGYSLDEVRARREYGREPFISESALEAKIAPRREMRAEYFGENSYLPGEYDPLRGRYENDERIEDSAEYNPALHFIRRAYERPRGRGGPSEFDFVKRPMAEDEFMDEGGPRALDSLPSEAAQRDAALRAGRWDVQQYEAGRKGVPSTVGAVDSLGPVFAALDNGYAGRTPAASSDSILAPRYFAAGMAPGIGGPDPMADEERRRRLAGGR
jgi:hypothetical protein